MSGFFFQLTSCHEHCRAIARAFRIVLCGVLFAVAAGTSASESTSTPAGPSASAGTPTLGRLRFPAGSTHELLAERIWLHGLPAQVLLFDVPQSPPDFARALSSQQPALADLHVLPGQLILSGRVGDDHWVVQMEGAGMQRTVGSISSVGVRAVAANPQPAWLPGGARIRLDVAVSEGGARMSERIWQHALPPAKMAPLLNAALRRDGWAREPTVGAAQWWMRERERMKVLVVPLDTGSGLRVNGWTR